MATRIDLSKAMDGITVPGKGKTLREQALVSTPRLGLVSLGSMFKEKLHVGSPYTRLELRGETQLEGHIWELHCGD